MALGYHERISRPGAQLVSLGQHLPGAGDKLFFTSGRLLVVQEQILQQQPCNTFKREASLEINREIPS